MKLEDYEFDANYFTDVPEVGDVAVSDHAQSRASDEHISEEIFKDVLYNGEHVPDGWEAVWKQKNGVRIVLVLKPDPYKGVALAVTCFRIKEQANAKLGRW